MLQILKTSVFILLLGLSMTVSAQQNQGGETCAEAKALGTIGAVGSCPNGAGFKLENTNLAAGAVKNPSCDNIGTNHDLWYSFVAPASKGVILKINLRTAARIEAAVYDGCGGNEIICSSSNSDGLCVSGLTEGDTYYLQLWSDGFATGTFDFCVESKPSPAVNNECENAIDLPVQMSTTPCDASTKGELYNNFGATASGVLPKPSCGTFGIGVDTWFSFIVPVGGVISLEMTEAFGPQDWAMAAYSGTCGSLVELACDDDSGHGLKPKINLAGRTPGEVILLRVWEFGGNDFGSFRINASVSNVALPSNNGCAGAIDLTVVDQANACITPECGHNENATASGEFPTPSCGYFGEGRDVWYKVMVPMSGNLAIIVNMNNPTGPQDWAMAAYSGSCGDLSEIACDDDGGDGFYPRIDMINKTPGDYIYIRIWEYQGNDEGSFTICVTSKTPLAVELISFNGKSKDGMNELDWVTASEVDMDVYNLQRSTDGQNWMNVYSAPAKNIGTEEATTYSFEDRTAPARAYYRLESKEVNGTEDYSNVIFLENKKESNVNFGIYPQPASETVKLNYNNADFVDSEVVLEIFSITGSKVRSTTINAFQNNYSLNISNLAEGIYMVKLGNGNSVTSTKLIVK